MDTKLMALVYHPGPTTKADGSPIELTAHHVDASWITLLRTTKWQTLSVQVGERNFSPVPQYQDGILVQIGSVLEQNSITSMGQPPIFRGTCHWVTRDSTSVTDTRLSVAFFYDRVAEPEFHGRGGEAVQC